MKYTVSDIARVLDAESRFANPDEIISTLLIDSRRTHVPAGSVFFALKSERRDGHLFIRELYGKGARNFVVVKGAVSNPAPDCNWIIVDDTLEALQSLAAYHRSRFSIPIIAITGSNGKTIVKEWLYQLLQNDHDIARSPKSYNSQIGVPLSLWQLKEHHTLGIFEAGISKPGEMVRLERMIRPDIGIMTNLGDAHSEGFTSQNEKAWEKFKLFIRASRVVYPRDHVPGNSINGFIKEQPAITFYTWGHDDTSFLKIIHTKREGTFTRIVAKHNDQEIAILIPFTDDVSVTNAITCWTVMLMLGYDNEVIASRMSSLHPVNMRLELKKGIHNSSLINDSYNADTDSLQMALNFLDQQAGSAQKTVILSDFLQSSIPATELYSSIRNSLLTHGVKKVIGIGHSISKNFSSGNGLLFEGYASTEEFLSRINPLQFRDQIVLIKGARMFGFERIVHVLELKVHQTMLEINLNAIAHNIKQYQRRLNSGTRIMAMVKAFSYGSGGSEIAGVLQYHKVDYLGVAYADEGVDLRRAGIMLPIMVMNPEESSFEAITEHELEPEIYSFDILYAFDAFLKKNGITNYPVHIELETGMNRLGFDSLQVESLAEVLSASTTLRVASVFTHLASGEVEADDDFTKQQFDKFITATAKIKEKLSYPFLSHIANSAAIIRHPSMHLDMVRLGIGMYGVDTASSGKLDLMPVATLRSTVSQIKYLKAGESVSYNRKGIVDRDSVIATVRIGYADGYPRRLGNGKGFMWIRGRLAPVIGTICMDMTMIDVTGIDGVKEGDEVVIFGKELSVEQLAQWAGTIPYEIMTGISQRVKRIYFEE